MKCYGNFIRDWLCFSVDEFNDPVAKVTRARVTHYVFAYLRHRKVLLGKTQGQGIGASAIVNCMSALRWLKV